MLVKSAIAECCHEFQELESVWAFRREFPSSFINPHWIYLRFLVLLLKSWLEFHTQSSCQGPVHILVTEKTSWHVYKQDLILLWYNTKYFDIIWKVTLHSYKALSFPGSKNLLADKQDLSDWDNLCSIWRHLARKTFCLHFTKSTPQRLTLPGKWENISPYEQKKLFDSVKCFLANRDNVCLYEQALK